MIEWSPEAVEDLELIAEYIARDSEYYARAVAREIISAVRALGDFPQVGRIVPEIGKQNIRERFVYSYRLIYRLDPDRVLIIAIIHGKRLLENIGNRF